MKKLMELMAEELASAFEKAGYNPEWEEFEAYETAEAKFAHVLDNCQPLLLNDASGGKSWKEHTVHKSQIYKRNEHTAEGSREIWEYMQQLIDKHIQLGHVIDD